MMNFRYNWTQEHCVENVFAEVMRYRLELGDDWEIDKMLFDAQNHRIDVHVSHSGRTLVLSF